MKKHIIRTIIVFILTAFITSACSDNDSDDVAVVSISLNREELTLGIGEKKQLIAVVNPTNATNKDVNWDSENAAIATVGEDGLVTAISEGETKIYVRSGNIVNYCKLIVTGHVVPVERLVLNETSLTLEKDEAFTLIATVEPNNASNQQVTWESSDPSAVSVDTKGNIVALKAGASANIKAEAGGKSAICTVTVKSLVVDYPETSYQLSSDGKELEKWLGSEEHIDMNIDSKLKDVETIKIAAFESNAHLKSIKIGEKVTVIESYAFTVATNLASVIFPANLKTIGAFAFNTAGLQNLNLPNGITSIGSGAFKATKITSAIIPQSVENYGADVFHSCTELVSAILPNSVTRIEGGAFAGCTKLETLELGKSISFFEEWSINGCTSLKTLKIATAMPTPIDANVFWGIDLSKVALEVPVGAANAYKGIAVWKEFGTIVEVSF